MGDRIRAIPLLPIKNFVVPCLCCLLSISVVGVTAAYSRAYLSSPFFSRLNALWITFRDGQTQEEVTGNLWKMMTLALERRLTYEVQVWKGPPQLPLRFSESALGWVSIYLVFVIISFSAKNRWTTYYPLWLATSVLTVSRIPEIICSSYWFWLPNWNPIYIEGLLKLTLGLPGDQATFLPLLLRMSGWLLAKVEVLAVLFLTLHRLWRPRLVLTLLSCLGVAVVSTLLYRVLSLSFGWGDAS
ncbi:MAG: hypothetical protein NZ959_07555 [Armatimonadetes bacterium]|nr:hypothetical protein [Armatimonadota bacterium]MDW8122205.1 hypothetical protein [Armatimonadota bacterium]